MVFWNLIKKIYNNYLILDGKEDLTSLLSLLFYLLVISNYLCAAVPLISITQVHTYRYVKSLSPCQTTIYLYMDRAVKWPDLLSFLWSHHQTELFLEGPAWEANLAWFSDWVKMHNLIWFVLRKTWWVLSLPSSLDSTFLIRISSYSKYRKSNGYSIID